MPDRNNLKIGDSLRLLRVPEADLAQRAHEGPRAAGELLPTATILEYLLRHNPIVIIDQIDDYHQPWFSAWVKTDTDIAYHSLAVMEDDCWEIVYQYQGDHPPPKEHLIARIKRQIDDILLDEFEEDYQKLAEHSEKRDWPEAKLRQAYAALDQRSGLSGLFTRLAELTEKPAP